MVVKTCLAFVNLQYDSVEKTFSRNALIAAKDDIILKFPSITSNFTADDVPYNEILTCR